MNVSRSVQGGIVSLKSVLTVEEGDGDKVKYGDSIYTCGGGPSPTKYSAETLGVLMDIELLMEAMGFDVKKSLLENPTEVASNALEMYTKTSEIEEEGDNEYVPKEEKNDDKDKEQGDRKH